MTMAQPVIGREREIAALRTAVHDVHGGGSAFVVDGEAGIGKSSLVADVVEYARSRGARVLTTTGTLDESAEPYAALHRLLYPLRAGIASLPGPQRRALDVAFGVATGVQPSPLLAGLAALTLLSDAAAATPLLIVAEDLHWIDTPSEWALRMVARRVAEDPIVVVMSTRDTDALDEPGLRRLHLAPLDDAAAAELLRLDASSWPEPRGTRSRSANSVCTGRRVVPVSGPSSGGWNRSSPIATRSWTSPPGSRSSPWRSPAVRPQKKLPRPQGGHSGRSRSRRGRNERRRPDSSSGPLLEPSGSDTRSCSPPSWQRRHRRNVSRC
jgi:hypothetical protein